MPPFAIAFLVIWFSGLIAISLASLLFDSQSHSNRTFMGDFGPLLMLIFGAALVFFGRYLARNEAKFITDFLI